MYADYIQNRVNLDPFYPGREHLDLIYTRQVLPDPGAPNYAYQTYQLPPFTQIGTGVPVARPIKEHQPTYFQTQQIPLSGQPTLTGQFVSAPLFNPNSLGLPGGQQNVNPIFAGAAV